MILQWTIDVSIEPSLTALMQMAADCAVEAEGIRKRCAVCIRLCDDDAIHKINHQYRKVDRATDVLSFPTLQYPKGKTAGQTQGLLNEAYDDELNACMLGDLIISVDHIRQQAQEYGHSQQREAAYLLVHGLCHLMGYDHIQDEEKAVMRAMEQKILSKAGLKRETDAGINDDTLLAMAREAKEKSYSPYSHFKVGAALLCADGKIFQGCNIENASFGLTNCAERTAIFKAVSEGERIFTTIAIAAEGTPPWPCGACRQVMNEFAPQIRVLVTWDGKVAEAPLSQLLPYGFGPEQLGNA